MRENGFLKLFFSPLQKLETDVKLYEDDRLIGSLPLHADVLDTWQDSVPLTTAAEGKLRVVVGEDWLTYSEMPTDNILRRPTCLPDSFNWESAYGLYTQGEQWMNQKVYDKAQQYLDAALHKDPYLLPALSCQASLYYRQGKYEDALAACKTGLSIHAYQGELNYLYGLCNQALGYNTDAKDGFSIAALSPSVRSASYVKLAEMYMRDADWVKAESYALQALEYNRLNLSADQALMVIYRKSNQPEKAKERIVSVLSQSPLYHPARYEQCRSGLATKEDFTSLIRNELPFEIYLEMADWYEGINCADEALDLLSLAENYPIANYEAAYLLHKKGNEVAAIAALEKANVQSPALIYPYRPSTLKALEWGANTRPDWKITYYQGLIYWANQNKEKAASLFDSVSTTDYVPFYLCRASMKSGEAKLADLRRAEQIGKSWRTGFALISQYVVNSQWPEAVEVGKQYMKLYPGNYYIGLKYAKALCESGQYQVCISLLSRLQVLPNEGAYAGRAANLYQAMDLLNRKKYKSAIQRIEDSKHWTENLGVGKPYDNMIDNRLENYLESCVCKGTGDNTRATSLLEQIASYKPSAKHFNSADLLTVLALRTLSRKEEADRLVATWIANFPDDKMVQWSVAVYKGENEKAKALLDARSNHTDTTPWETSFRDADLELIIRYFR